MPYINNKELFMNNMALVLPIAKNISIFKEQLFTMTTHGYCYDTLYQCICTTLPCYCNGDFNTSSDLLRQTIQSFKLPSTDEDILYNACSTLVTDIHSILITAGVILTLNNLVTYKGMLRNDMAIIIN